MESRFNREALFRSLYDQTVSSLYKMAKDAGAKAGQINRCLNHKSNQKEAFIALLTKLLDANKDGKVSLTEMTTVAGNHKKKTHYPSIQPSR